MTIQYYEKIVYGNELLYIKDPAIATRVEILLNKKTISYSDISILTDLGLRFVQVLPPKA